MEERKFVGIRKEEFGVKEFVKKEFGKGKVIKLGRILVA